MGIASSLPGIEPGRAGRNVLLGGAYLSLLSIGILSLSPLAVIYRSRNGC